LSSAGVHIDVGYVMEGLAIAVLACRAGGVPTMSKKNFAATGYCHSLMSHIIQIQ
jgi:hypothetical protein